MFPTLIRYLKFIRGGIICQQDPTWLWVLLGFLTLPHFSFLCHGASIQSKVHQEMKRKHQKTTPAFLSFIFSRFFLKFINVCYISIACIVQFFPVFSFCVKAKRLFKMLFCLRNDSKRSWLLSVAVDFLSGNMLPVQALPSPPPPPSPRWAVTQLACSYWQTHSHPGAQQAIQRMYSLTPSLSLSLSLLFGPSLKFSEKLPGQRSPMMIKIAGNAQHVYKYRLLAVVSCSYWEGRLF